MTRQPALPTYHIRPTRGWLNDPNGMTYRDGRWHVFYQHNPQAAVHGDIHWGHVSSPDLASWDEHPVAFGPTPDGPDSMGCWSGVFVNPPTPGERPMVAYSGVTDSTFASTTVLRQAQDDALNSWSEPWVVATTPSVDGVAVMRDPFLFTYGGRRWALHGAGLSTGEPAVLLHSCDDLDSWVYEGIWLRREDTLGAPFPADIWECPQLAFVDGRAVVVLSTQENGQLVDVLAVVGDVVDDPEHPGRPAFKATGFERLDGGDVCYAPQFSTDPRGSWHLGWVRQEGVHADETPEDEDLVAGCLTLPRRLAVREGRLVIFRDLGTDGLLRAPSVLPAGVHTLPSSSMVATTGGTLTSDQGRIDLPKTRVEVWVDGEVVEVYPDGAAPSDDLPIVPATYRHVDTASWRLAVPDGAEASVRLVARPERT